MLQTLGTALTLAALCVVRDLLDGPPDPCDDHEHGFSAACRDYDEALDSLPAPWKIVGVYATHPEITWEQAHERIEGECYVLDCEAEGRCLACSELECRCHEPINDDWDESVPF